MKQKSLEYEQKYETIITKEAELRDEYNRIIQKRQIEDFKKNWYGTFTVGFEDKNITIERFKHHLKISLNIENTDFQIHSVRTERLVGTVKDFSLSSTFADEEGSNEMVKFYVSFYHQNNHQKLVGLLKELKTQIRSGKSKLKLINPLFLGINYGKITVNSDDYNQISLDKCDLISREGIYIKSTYLLWSIYKYTDYITNQIYIKILAFDNQNSIEYMIDLDYADLLDMVDSNTKLLASTKDLATYLTNWLAYFKNQNGDEFLVCENRLFFADYTGIFGSAEKRSSKEYVNKTIMSKHNNRERILHIETGTETEWDINVIHEAFDELFNQTVHAYNCQLKVLKGRLSNIIIAEFKFDTIYAYKLVLYESKTSPDKKISSERIYINNHPKWVISIETFGIGDGGLLKIIISDAKARHSEEIVLQKKQDEMYTRLNEINSSMLLPEEKPAYSKLIIDREYFSDYLSR